MQLCMHLQLARARHPNAAWTASQAAHLNERRKVQIRGGVGAPPGDGDVRDVGGDKAPAMLRRAQQRVDQVGAAADVQTNHL